MVGWLVGNAVFLKMTLMIFLLFYMKLGDYKDRKVTEQDFWEKFLIWRYSQKHLQISPNLDTLIFFSKTALTIFFVFRSEVSTKYDLQFEWNLSFRKICYLEIFDFKIVKIWLFSYNCLVLLMHSCSFLIVASFKFSVFKPFYLKNLVFKHGFSKSLCLQFTF